MPHNYQEEKMKPREIILIGGGGHCRSLIDVIEDADNFKIAGIVDKEENVGKKVLDYYISFSMEELSRLLLTYDSFVLAFGQIKDTNGRPQLYQYLKYKGAKFPPIISARAKVSSYAKIDEATVVMHHAVINSNAKIGKGCIINTAAVIEHDCVIGDFCHVSTESVINGGSTLGRHSFAGSNSVLLNGIKTCPTTVIGAGSVVIHDIDQPGIWVGNPARRIR